MSTLSYFINQLDNLDPKLYEPLAAVSWGRDIMLRPGVSMSHESTSFIRSSFASTGTQRANGKPWITAKTTVLPGISIDGQLLSKPIRLLGNQLSYTSVELERSQLLGQSLDVAQFSAMNRMYQMHTDEMVYIGDEDTGSKGLLNSTEINVGPVTGGAWASASADVILAQVDEMLRTAWAASGYAICPNKILLPPTKFAFIASKIVSAAGDKSILTYLEENSIALRNNGTPLEIRPAKYLAGRGVAGSDRMVAYTNNVDYVRFPMVPVRRETPYTLGISFNAPYIWAYGELEIVYPETLIYRDGI
jgi:hypothetical protein